MFTLTGFQERGAQEWTSSQVERTLRLFANQALHFRFFLVLRQVREFDEGYMQPRQR